MMGSNMGLQLLRGFADPLTIGALDIMGSDMGQDGCSILFFVYFTGINALCAQQVDSSIMG